MLPKSSVPVPGNEVDVWLYSRWIGLEHEVDEAGQELVGRGRILVWNLEHVKYFLGAPEKEWKQNGFVHLGCIVGCGGLPQLGGLVTVLLVY